MRTILALAAVTAIGVTGTAYATDQTQEKTQERVITADQMKAAIDRLGYDVDRMKNDNGTYKALLTDRDSGGKVKAAFDAETGVLVYARLAREEHEAEERMETREEARKHRKVDEQNADARKERREDRNRRHEDRD